MLGVCVVIRVGTWAGYDLRMNSFAYQSGCVGVSFDLPEDWSRSCRRNMVSNLYYKARMRDKAQIVRAFMAETVHW
jgi:hypothetical protein